MAPERPPSLLPPSHTLSSPNLKHTHLTVGRAPSGCPSKLLEASPPPFYNLPPPSASTEAARRLLASPTILSFIICLLVFLRQRLQYSSLWPETHFVV